MKQKEQVALEVCHLSWTLFNLTHHKPAYDQLASVS